MKRNIIIWSVALVLVAVAVYTMIGYKPTASNTPSAPNNATVTTPTDSNQSTTTPPISEEKIKAPDFTLTDLTGRKVSLSDFKGKNVYLNFWATWCKYCEKEMPDIQKVFEENKDSNLVILAIDVGEDSKTVKGFMDKNNLTFTALLDKDKRISSLYSISGYPTSIFIDKDGNVSSGKEGLMSLEEMRVAIKNIK